MVPGVHVGVDRGDRGDVDRKRDVVEMIDPSHCPGCGVPITKWLPSAEFYPGRTYSWLCDNCHQKITVEIKR